MKLHKRIVVKVGTNVITDERGWLDHGIIESLVQQMVELKGRSVEVILVSSGSMGAGRALLNLPPKVDDVVQRQVLSSLGQVKLIEAYSTILAKHKKLCCQILVCKQDFRDRHHYLNMKNCFSALLRDDILPVVNENDAIAVDELMFTDNDELAGLIASMMNADALMVLTNVDGVYDRHPKDPNAKVIPVIEVDKETTRPNLSDEKSLFGRGGMRTKYRVASHLASLGTSTYIINGKSDSAIVRVCDGEQVGTFFPPAKNISNIKRWISSASGQEKGAVWINHCAERMLSDRSGARSLLPIGVVKVEGAFVKGDLIRVKGESGKDLGLGIACYGGDKALENMGQKGKRALIHYNHLYLKGAL